MEKIRLKDGRIITAFTSVHENLKIETDTYFALAKNVKNNRPFELSFVFRDDTRSFELNSPRTVILLPYDTPLLVEFTKGTFEYIRWYLIGEGVD